MVHWKFLSDLLKACAGIEVIVVHVYITYWAANVVLLA
jgi:hypothetical protein